MKIVINNCYGGFGLSHKAVMLYAELSGFKLYPFVGIDKIKPYIEGKKEEFCIHYLKCPLNEDGTYIENSYFSHNDILRNDPILIKVIKLLKEKANGLCADLKVIKIPDDIEWEIEEYDGIEWISEKHRTWR